MKGEKNDYWINESIKHLRFEDHYDLVKELGRYACVFIKIKPKHWLGATNAGDHATKSNFFYLDARIS